MIKPSPNEAPNTPENDADIPLTDAMRAYLAAFDDFLRSRNRQDRLFARSAMSGLCDQMMSSAGVPRRDRSEAITADDLFDPKAA